MLNEMNFTNFADFIDQLNEVSDVTEWVRTNLDNIKLENSIIITRFQILAVMPTELVLLLMTSLQYRSEVHQLTH